MVFPRSVKLLLGEVTNYDNIVEMYLIQAGLFATLGCLLLAFKDSTSTKSWLLFFVPVALLVFSFRQHENMLWGFQISLVFVQTFGALALFFLHVSGRCRRSPGRFAAFVAALGSGTVASFSMAQGLLIRPAGLLQLFIGSTERPARRVLVLIWGLAGLAEWIVYFLGYERPGASSLCSTPCTIHW